MDEEKCETSYGQECRTVTDTKCEVGYEKKCDTEYRDQCRWVQIKELSMNIKTLIFLERNTTTNARPNTKKCVKQFMIQSMIRL